MTNQEAIYQQKYLKEMHNASAEVMESCDMAIKALSVDYEGMTEELSKFSGIGGLSKKGIFEIIKKYVENKEE